MKSTLTFFFSLLLFISCQDSVDDKVIFDHLADLSNGALKVPESKLPLTDSSEFLKNKIKTMQT